MSKNQEKESNPLQKERHIPAPKFRYQFDVTYKGTKGKEMDGKSETVPDLSISVRQMLGEHVRMNSDGLIERRPIWFNTEIPQIRDFTDLEKYSESLAERKKEVDEMVKKYNEGTELRNKEFEKSKAKEKEEKEEFKKFKNQKGKNETPLED